ncbi:hypothetical protein FS749_004510 [Ceratobasidium sp. UAMH 11750]|nr:hypothetical protein FS749_004510 [Ceratobasidium sp. UAMH 11750]
MRKQVVEGIRENQSLEAEVSELDVKIALVVQNVKSFEELVKARRRIGADSAAAHASRASVLAAHGDPFAAPNALDQQTMRRLELYQQLFYLLQTRGEYLARLFFTLSRSKVPEKNKRTVERVVLTLFGYGQESREDYLLLKLFQMSILEEIRPAHDIQDVILGHPMYLAIAVHYIKPKQIAYIRDTLKPIILEVISMEDLDLETDPVAIYKSLINQEEMHTGQPSLQKKDVTTEEAMMHHATREKYIHHLQKLQWLAGIFIRAILASTRRMPYAMRLLAREILAALRVRFPNQSEQVFAIALGRLIYYRYINPVIITPETYDVVPTTITPSARRNLANISKFLTQISSGQEFDIPTLTSVNAFVVANIPIMATWFFEVADVPDAETEYHAHEFLDVTVQPKPVYISPNEIYAMHAILTQNVDRVASDRDDPVKAILAELVGPPTLSATDELKDARDRAITLELTNRFAHVKDPHAEEKAIWVQAKRGVLAILRVQPAKDLVESLMQPVTENDEYTWEDIVDKELVTARMLQKRRLPSQGAQDSAYRLEDIRTLSFREVKARAIQYLLELEKRGKVTRTDGYQGILNAIAGDVRSKHRKRVQRKAEMDNMREALNHLKERKRGFEEQITSYHSYVDSAMNTMQRGKGKKRFVMPFTKQFFHLRDLQRAGGEPKFGSYKYSGQYLYDRGILLWIDHCSPRQFDRVDIVISSNQIGVFTVQLINNLPGAALAEATEDIRMEDLLQAQFENRVSLSLYDGLVKFNINLLLYQINKNNLPDHPKPKDKTLTRAKLAVEYASLQNRLHCPQGIYVVPSERSIRLWDGILFVHQGYYASAIFRFKITFLSDYPARAPVVHFTTDVFHPLVSIKDGTFSLIPRIPNWSSYDHNVFHVLHWIKASFKKQALDELSESSCLNKEAFRMYQDSTASFASLAAQSASLSHSSSSALYGDGNNSSDDRGTLAFSRANTVELDKLRSELGLSSWTS